MAKAIFTKQIRMTGTRNIGGQVFGPGQCPTITATIADTWVEMGVAVDYVEEASGPVDMPAPEAQTASPEVVAVEVPPVVAAKVKA